MILQITISGPQKLVFDGPELSTPQFKGLELLLLLHVCRPNDLTGSCDTEMASAASNLLNPGLEGSGQFQTNFGGLEMVFWSVNGGCCVVLSKGPEMAAAGLQNFRH